MTPFLAVLGRDVRLALSEGSAISTALGFYVIVVTILPLGLGPDLKLMSRIAPGVVWVALLLSALLSSDRIFHADHEDGTLEALALGPLPLELLAFAKSAAHWLTTGLPLTVLAPLLGLFLNLDIAAYPALVASMLIGTPAVSFLSAIGAALTLGTRRGGLLLSLIVLPLFVPHLVFGVATISNIITGTDDYRTPLLILIAISAACVLLSPFATAAALRLNLQ
jgi:heme exporter protein B